MSSPKSLLVLITLLAFSLQLHAAPDKPNPDSSKSKSTKLFPPITTLLPTGSLTVNTVALKPSKRAVELTNIFQKAIAKNPTWWRDYVKKNANLRPLPYHTNFGLTEPQYKELLSLARKFELTKTGTTKLNITKKDNTLIITFTQAPKSTQPLKLNLKDLSLTLPNADIKKPTQRDSGPNGGAIGPHKSYTWRREVASKKTNKLELFTLTVGQIKKSRKTFIQYQVAELENRVPIFKYETLLLFNPKTAPQKPKAK